MLTKKVLENTLHAALKHAGDFAEIYVEDRLANKIMMIGGSVESSVSGRDFGIGIRIFEGFNSVYGYTNDKREESLISLAENLSKSLKEACPIELIRLNEYSVPDINKIIKYPDTVNKRKKVELLKQAYNAAKDYDSIITQVRANYQDENQDILIANSEGLLKRDKRVRTRFSVQSVASKENEMQIGFDAPGVSKGFEYYDSIDVRDIGIEASRIAKTMINAEACPRGIMPVVIHNGFGGVLFHEACGHSLEATAVAKGNSVFSNKLGEQIASELVTAIDDGTLANQWGSLNIDDEGEETKRNVLIKDGILNSYLVDKLNSRRMNHKQTGSGRRESYKYAPTSRMNNTYIDNGSSKFDEIISSTENGLFAKKLGGGSVNPTTGEFNFAVMEGYIIKNGKIDRPVRGATLIGTGSKVLKNIDMVGNNLKMAQGVCGSLSGMVPVNVGQPTIRVKKMTVGGKGGKI